MSREQFDTRATAYVFGELPPEALAEFERELRQSEELQEEVNSIRETIAAIEIELAARSVDISDSRRETIERAIEAHSTKDSKTLPEPPPVEPNHATAPASHRHLRRIAALAASVVILCGLAYPYVRGTATRTAKRDVTSVGPETTIANLSKEEQVSQLVQSFNQLIHEDRYLEAESVAKQVAQLDPDAPIGERMLRVSRMGQQVSQATTEPNSPPAEETIEDRAKSWESLSRERAEFGVARPTAPGTSDSKLSASKRMEDEFQLSDQSADLELGFDAEIPNGGISNGGIPNGGMAGSHPLATNRGVTGGMAMGGGPADISSMEMMMGIGDMTLDGEVPNRRPSRRSRRPRDVSIASDTDVEITDMDMMMERQSALPEGDRFEPIEDNPFVSVQRSPLSTFSIDVDTASYAKVRSLLNQNVLPRADAVRIEELLNYFDYDYPAPVDDHPFAASMEIAACPWNPSHRLARVGIKGKEIESNRPSSNLVFLLDVSGSMDEPNKLPLVIEGMKMLTDQLTENDKVSIVVYAGAAGLVLDATRGDKKRRIVLALDRLKAGGSTNGSQGIMLAYELARDNFIVGGTNRVILCSDGDFNVGVTGTDQLVEIAEHNAKSNIFLSVLGFGTGNHNDAMMEQISNKGNGNYAFIDTKAEAKKVLVEQLGGTLVTIAKDVKIQIEFNPKHVASYRLIGYENRVLSAQDFNNDSKDAGEIGAGHTVTALYEIVPAEGSGEERLPDNLRYQEPAQLSRIAKTGETLVLKLRYKQPDGDTSTLIEVPAVDSGKRFSRTDRDFKFAAAVAAFGMLLRDSPHRGDATLAKVARIAREGAKGDDFGYRTEFVSLVEKAEQLRGF